MLTTIGLAAFVSLALAFGPATGTFVAQQARDVARPLAGTASLSGTVVSDDAAGRPVGRATVTLYVPGDPRTSRVTSTDDAGRFTLVGLPAGNVTVHASKPGYVTSYYGGRRPGSTIGVPIALTEGRDTPGIGIRILRGGVVTGFVQDETGRPMPLVMVRVQRLTVSPAGERTITPLLGQAGQGSMGTSDDRGVYRIFGLPPGEYVVSAQPRTAGFAELVSGTGSGELRQPTAEELAWAERQVRGLSSAGPTTAPPAPSRPVTYAQVFHPGTADISAATVVRLAPGEVRSDVDLRMLLVATSRIDGTVMDSGGQPAADIQVGLIPKGGPSLDRLIEMQQTGLLPMGSTSNVRTRADGAFSIQGLEPGEYLLMARTPPRLANAAAPPAPAMFAAADLTVSGSDIQGLTLVLEPGTSVSGRVTFESTTPMSGDPPRVSVRLANQTGALGGGVATAGSNGTVTLPPVAPGRYRLTAIVLGPSGIDYAWLLKSARLGGRDVTDAVFEVRPQESIGALAVALTDVAAELSGVVYDAANRPSADLSLLLFPADRAQWFRDARRLRPPIRAASDGKFAFRGLPEGDYYLVALWDFEPNDWVNPLFLDQIVPGRDQNHARAR